MTKATLQDAAEVIAGKGATLQDAAQAIVDGWTPGGAANKGWFVTISALKAAYPTAENGDWAIIGETDTVWVWDSDSADWVDTGSKSEVTLDMIIVKSLTMPLASTTPAGSVYQYLGKTNASYTHGYIYENVKTATYTGTVSFEAASLSGTTVACSGDNFANFLTESGVEPLSVVSGTITYDATGSLWVLVVKNADDETVLTFQEYQEDYEDFGFTFTGTPQDGDVIAFTCTVQEASASYAWNRIDVQPNAVTSVNGSTGAVTVQETLVSGTNIKTINGSSVLGAGDLTVGGLPSQTGQSGKFLTTDGTDASWETINALENEATRATGLVITGKGTANTDSRDGYSVIIGNNISGASYAGGGILIGNSISAGGYFNGVALIPRRTSIEPVKSQVGGAVVIGDNCSNSGGRTGGVIIGSENKITTSGANAIVLGGNNNTVSADYAIQIGGIGQTNADANTFKVANANGNFELMSADGTIPAERLGTGYDATKTQTLKNVQGVLTWVDD